MGNLPYIVDRQCVEVFPGDLPGVPALEAEDGAHPACSWRVWVVWLFRGGEDEGGGRDV